MIEIYHNNRCSKSRNAIAYLDAQKIEYKVIKYLEEIPSEKDLKILLKKLNIKPIELIRKGEKIWKENYKGKEMTDAQIIKAMVKHPKLIERPIIINKEKAVIARPTEAIEKVL